MDSPAASKTETRVPGDSSPPPEQRDVCPRAFSPPRRLHHHFGFYEGPPIPEDDDLSCPPQYEPPDVPFGRFHRVNDPVWFAVLLGLLPGPGYMQRPREPLWLVKMTLREVHRAMVYDWACRELYPERFLRRFVEVELPHQLWDVDLERSHCLAPDIRETEEEIEEDYDRRASAFVEKNSDYPLRCAVKGSPERPGYAGPQLRLVLEAYNTASAGAALSEVRRRHSRVRYPTDLRPYPGARALLYPGPTWRGTP
ncbi:hypothetical protein Emed_005753 [Eimeria media]